MLSSQSWWEGKIFVLPLFNIMLKSLVNAKKVPKLERKKQTLFSHQKITIYIENIKEFTKSLLE